MQMMFTMSVNLFLRHSMRILTTSKQQTAKVPQKIVRRGNYMNTAVSGLGHSPANGADHLFRRFLAMEKMKHAIIGRYKIDQRRVVHRVIGQTGIGAFCGINFENFFHMPDLIDAASEADETFIEAAQVFLQDCWRVALGVDRDKERLDAGGIVSQALQHQRKTLDLRRAYIGAKGEAEKHQAERSGKILVADSLSVMVD